MITAITQTAIFSLQQLLDVLRQTKQEEYSRYLPILSGSSLGMHVRHIVEFYQALLIDIEEKNTIHYDARNRDLRLETDIDFSIETIQGCITRLQQIQQDKILFLITTVEEQRVQMASSILRECFYLVEHTIHHLAIVKIAYQQVFPSIDIPETFGVAHSTIKHKQLVHSNLSTAS